MRVMTMLMASCCRRQCRSVSTAVYVVVAATHLLCLSDFSQGNLSRMFSIVRPTISETPVDEINSFDRQTGRRKGSVRDYQLFLSF